ncbi:hypothetical protein BDZ97DRAFT_560836 [Flammula alnicola]|nr:hypothetical protein BDZ97DRAFT_560836 [Flammula alnicola]
MLPRSPTPLQLLLTTNVPPSEYERELIQRVISATQELIECARELLINGFLNIMRLPDDEPSTLPRKQTLEYIFDLYDFVDDHRAILSPLRRFPPELIREILLWAMPKRRFETNLFVDTDEPDRWTVLAPSQVCRLWRDVALSTEQFWTTIPILHEMSRPIPEYYHSIIQMFVERSGNRPIDIAIVVTLPWLSVPQEGLDVSPSLELLLSQSHRWKSAILHLDPSLVELLGYLDVPILESLNFKSRYEQWDVNWYPELCVVANAPKLKHAIVDDRRSFLFLDIPWNQLRTFTGLPDDLEVLRPAGPVLETCVFRGPVGVMHYPEEHPIHFAKLTSLRIANTNYQHTREHGLQFGWENDTPFRWIIAPVLQKLEIIGHPVIAGASPIINGLLSTTLPSNSLLKSLTFHVRGMTEDDFKRLLAVMPNLEYLDLCDTPSSYFASLVETHQPPTESQEFFLVPRLGTLKIRNFSDAEAGTIVYMYELRQVLFYEKPGDGKFGSAVSHVQQDLRVDLTFRSFRACLSAQDRIEGWDKLRTAHATKGSEYTKVLGWARHLASQFLGRRDLSIYGVSPDPSDFLLLTVFYGPVARSSFSSLGVKHSAMIPSQNWTTSFV